MIIIKDFIKQYELGDPENIRLQQAVGKKLRAKGFIPVLRSRKGIPTRAWVQKGEIGNVGDPVAIDAAIDNHLTPKT